MLSYKVFSSPMPLEMQNLGQAKVDKVKANVAQASAHPLLELYT